jgi:glutamate 5-kinase
MPFLYSKGTKPLSARRRLTVVLGIGTSSIVDEKTHEPILSILSLIVETAIRLRRDGHRVVIVSSGAIGVGLQRMNMPKRPKHLAQVQVGLQGLKYVPMWSDA